ncbi:hypothetical protein T8A63_07170 [Sulfitobacter sp. OXR-159]|jgi:hypothetical protein|uniref:hypothetical protein n=1 Tax=Sulfitobacter sp. OXR-159 TaxID=3100174 RepID=UPI002AC89FC4|nr:hypothetical protein [Sulfitobacter sp. OXR-159]WPZ30736.1 hypothetical protein T8A63_06660 [Sulfitobacter sp. OXR-159]WPZ30837.1 hypothetical protein T8A63_07170 [Sulfitobacter sp. OXR-159]
MNAPSTKSLFRATKAKRKIHPAQMLIGGLPEQRKPDAIRDPLDYDPTPRDATAAFLAAEGDRLREIGGPIWENAVGGGHMAREIAAHGFDVVGSDIVDRGHPGTIIRPFYSWDGTYENMGRPPADIIITNPPYNEVSARDGHGRWLEHIEKLGVRYAAMLLNWDWIAARINGMDELHARFPVSRAYVCCWKIDFRGGGSPPQRNGWLVWDRDWQGETVLRRLFREGGEPTQERLL